VYINSKDESTLEDPRLGPLPPGWRIVYDDDTKLDDFWFENEHTKKTEWGDPRLTKEALLARGVDMKEFVLI
jgi:hypothetical protein